MVDPIEPTPTPTPTPTPAPTPTPLVDNQVIRDMRNQINNLENALKERIPKEDHDRVLAELTELKSKLPVNEAVIQSYESTLQQVYDAEIASAPEAVRESLRNASSMGSLPDRIKTLQAVKQIISTSTVTGINPTNPTTPVGVPQATPPATPEPTATPAVDPNARFVPPGWNSVLKAPGTTVPTT